MTDDEKEAYRRVQSVIAVLEVSISGLLGCSEPVRWLHGGNSPVRSVTETIPSPELDKAITALADAKTQLIAIEQRFIERLNRGE